jgi:hypothetical protein
MGIAAMWEESPAANCVSIQMGGLRNTVKGSVVPSETDPFVDSSYHLSTKASLLRNVEQQQGDYILPSRLNIKYIMSLVQTDVSSS